MSVATNQGSRCRAQLRLVRGNFRPVVRPTEWQSVARAVVACTHELARHLLEQRWGRVDEVMRERRELLFGMEGMAMDIEGRRCLMALTQATEESEAAVSALAARMGSTAPR